MAEQKLKGWQSNAAAIQSNLEEVYGKDQQLE